MGTLLIVLKQAGLQNSALILPKAIEHKGVRSQCQADIPLLMKSAEGTLYKAFK
jgi:hypothetical protein